MCIAISTVDELPGVRIPCTTRPACHLDVVQAKDAVVGESEFADRCGWRYGVISKIMSKIISKIIGNIIGKIISKIID